MHSERGFTLIELMITVAIVAILASVALPAYNDSVRKGRRADAQAFLSEVVARQQHFLLDRRAYASSITDGPATNGLGMTIPPNVENFYAVKMTTNNAARPPVFSVTAEPLRAQAGDKCASLTIDQRGTRSATGTGSCW